MAAWMSVVVRDSMQPKVFYWLKETHFSLRDLCLNQRAPNKQLYGQKAYFSFHCHKLTLHSDEISFYVSNIWIAYEILPVCCLCCHYMANIYIFVLLFLKRLSKGIYNFRHHIHSFINSIIHFIFHLFIQFCFILFTFCLFFFFFDVSLSKLFFIIYHLSP